MADLKIKLKRRNGAGFDDLFPETPAGNILTSAGNALSTFSSELLVASQDGSNITFVTGDGDGGFNLRTASDVLGDFSIASANYATGQCSDGQYDGDFEACLANGGTYTPTASHNHSQAQIKGCYVVENNLRVYKASRGFGENFDEFDQLVCETPSCSILGPTNQNDCINAGGTWWAGGSWVGLDTALTYKAGLDGGKIQLSQLPLGVNIKAMKFVNTTGELGTQAAPKGLSEIFTQLNNLSPQALTFLIGDYFIVDEDVNRWITQDVSGLGDAYQFVLNESIADDDQNELITDKVVVEKGDRIVFTGFSGVTAGSYTLKFAIINSATNVASVGTRGIASLSAENQLLSEYNSTSRTATEVVDEKSLRDAMKDQRRIVEFTGNTTNGTIKYYAALSANLPAGAADGEFAIVGAGTVKDVWGKSLGSWGDLDIDVTFPTNATTIPTAGTDDAKDIIFYDPEEIDYLYVSATSNGYSTFTKELNNPSSTILPVDGDLVYWISP